MIYSSQNDIDRKMRMRMKTKYRHVSFYGNAIRRGKVVYREFCNDREKYVLRYLLSIPGAFIRRQLFFHIASFFGLHNEIQSAEYNTMLESSVHVFRKRCAPSEHEYEGSIYGYTSKGRVTWTREARGVMELMFNHRFFKSPRVKIHKVAVGTSHTLFCTEEGTLYGFGTNTYGELAVGDCKPRTIPTRILLNGTRIENVGCGAHFSIVSYRDGCFTAPVILGVCGRNNSGQLGCGVSTLYLGARNFASHMGVPRFTRVFIDAKSRVKQLSCGWSHSLLLLMDGSVLATGLGYLGRLGLSSDKSENVFKRVNFPHSDPIEEISAGETHSLARSRTRVYTFGEGIRTPTEIQNEFNVMGILAGDKMSVLIGGSSTKTEIKSIKNTDNVVDLIVRDFSMVN